MDRTGRFASDGHHSPDERHHYRNIHNLGIIQLHRKGDGRPFVRIFQNFRAISHSGTGNPSRLHPAADKHGCRIGDIAAGERSIEGYF